MIWTVLAVYRVSHMIAREDGPFDVFSNTRARVGQESWIGRGLNCVWCISFWLSLLALITPKIILKWLGIAGAVLAIDKVAEWHS